jgi:hypothetical protein
MQSISIGRFEGDPQAQGVIRPEDNSWQLVLDKDGFPHLYIRCKLEDDGTGKPGVGMLCLEDMLHDNTTIPDLMKSTFGGKLSEAEEAKAHEEYLVRKEATGIPCPR